MSKRSTRPFGVLFTILFLLGSTLSAQRDSDFMRQLRKAHGAGDADRMAALVEEHPHVAMLAVIETCELVSQGSNDELEEDVDSLQKAWKQSMGTQFVDQQYEYFSLLQGQYKTARFELVGRYRKELLDFEAGTAATLPESGLQFKGLSEAFEEVGDLFMAATCADKYARCFEEEKLGRDADLRRTCEGLGRALELRAKLGLPAALFAKDKARYDQLEHDGFGDVEKGPEGRALARMDEDASYRPVPLGGKFRLVEDFEGVDRPYYGSDGIYGTWDVFQMGKDGSSGSFGALRSSPTLIRETVAKASIDANGDGKGEHELSVTGNQVAISFDFGEGEDARTWGFLSIVGNQRDTYQGIQPFNLAPTDDSMMIFLAPAASIVGMLGETEVQVFDDNMDALYGSWPVGRGLTGLQYASSQMDMDSVRIGKSTRAVPWSEYMQVGDDWYKFLPNEQGTDVVVQKWDLETGILKLDFKGPKVDYLVLRGEGNLENTYIDIAAASKGVAAPVGSYRLFTGRIGEGKRMQKAKALILPGLQSRSWRVIAGETTKVEMGAPFSFEFEFSQNEEAVSIAGRSLFVAGSAGETYQRLWNCVPRPEASLRKAGSKKGGKGTKMRPAGSQEEMFEGGFDVVWFPFDAEVPKKKSEDAEVQLVEKKNKLFGKIESNWKAQ